MRNDYFNFYDANLAGRVTATGQDIIAEMHEKLKQFANEHPFDLMINGKIYKNGKCDPSDYDN